MLIFIWWWCLEIWDLFFTFWVVFCEGVLKWDISHVFTWENLLWRLHFLLLAFLFLSRHLILFFLLFPNILPTFLSIRLTFLQKQFFPTSTAHIPNFQTWNRHRFNKLILILFKRLCSKCYFLFFTFRKIWYWLFYLLWLFWWQLFNFIGIFWCWC